MLDLWTQTRNELEQQIAPALFDAYFAAFVPVGMDERSLTLSTSNEMAAIMVEKSYLDLLEECLQKATGQALKIRITTHEPVEESAETVPAAEAPELPASQQLSLFDAPAAPVLLSTTVAPQAVPQAAPRPVAAVTVPNAPSLEEAIAHAGLNPALNFDSYVVGSSNEFAYEAALAAARNPGQLYNPLFIYGGVGLGKTHLMNALGIEILRHNPAARVRFISSETFLNELIDAIQSRKMDTFRQKNRVSVDCLLIDDIQFIAGKEQTQEEFFHTFNALYQMGRQIVITSDRIPQEMPKLEERLVSRLNMGLIADLQPPELETRIAILRNLAAQQGFVAPPDVLEYIATQVRSNVRELHGSLRRIGTFAQVNREPISLGLAQSQLGRVHRDPNFNVNPDTILRLTAEAFGVSVRDIKGPKRSRNFAMPRKVAMYLARTHTSASYPELGAIFDRDHSTVLVQVRSVEKLINDGDPVRHQISAIERRLN